MTIGENIKYYRKKKKLTQKQLAESLQVAVGTIQQYELGKREPKFDMLTRISDKLQIEPSALYGFEEDTTENNFYHACSWLEDAEISIDAPNPNDGLQQYYLYTDDLSVSCKMDKIDIIQLVDECVKEANEVRDDIAIKNIKRSLKSMK